MAQAWSGENASGGDFSAVFVGVEHLTGGNVGHHQCRCSPLYHFVGSGLFESKIRIDYDDE
jgi:hypothetical protein